MYLKCNNCHFEGDVEPTAHDAGLYYLPCPACGVVKIVTGGEVYCDFCRGQPVHVTYLTRVFALPPPMNAMFTERSRRWATCEPCSEDVEHARLVPEDIAFPIKRIINRGCDVIHAEVAVRRGMHELMYPLWRLVIENIEEGPTPLN